MQKKQLNRALIIAVSLIWITVLYKFLAPYFIAKETVVTADYLEVKPKPVVKKKDTVVLFFPERDPFLGKRKKQVKISKPVVSTIKTSPNRVKTKITVTPWPKIEYMGFVKAKNNSGRLALLRIDGQLHRVNKNERVQSLRIGAVYKDSIAINKGKELRYFKKS